MVKLRSFKGSRTISDAGLLFAQADDKTQSSIAYTAARMILATIPYDQGFAFSTISGSMVKEKVVWTFFKLKTLLQTHWMERYQIPTFSIINSQDFQHIAYSFYAYTSRSEPNSLYIDSLGSSKFPE